MKGSFKLGGLEIKSRLSIGDVRNAKAHHSIDLADTSQEGYATRMAFDGLVFVEVVYALYNRQIMQKFSSREAFEDGVDSEEVEGAREEVIAAISGFFPLPRIVYMKMQETLATNLNLEIPKA